MTDDHPRIAYINRFDARREYFFDEGCFINELNNSPDDAAVSMAQARVAPGTTTRWHRLQDVTERYVILTGIGLMEVGDLPPQEVHPGDTITIPPLCRQRIANPGDADLVFLAICSPRFVPECYEDLEAQ